MKQITIAGHWIWRRGQQIFGAAVATIAVGYLLYCIVLGRLPGDLGYDLPNPYQGTAYQLSSHDPRIDNGEIKQAIGLCHGLQIDPSKLNADGQEDVRPVNDQQESIKPANRKTDSSVRTVPLWSDTVPKSLIAWSNTMIGTRVSSFEFAAISDSARIAADRLKYEEGTRERQDRIRRYQVSVLLLTAAASFLVGVKTLLSNNNDSVSFPYVMQGAWLPISVAALLVPVVATVYSGIIAFDNDPNVALRYARALAQLEQLHGRIVIDVAGDPLLCGLKDLDPNSYDVSGGQAAKSNGGTTQPDNDPHPNQGPGKAVLKEIPPSAYACLLNHEDKVRAWEQRYEQILNDASQTLAQAGDLIKDDTRTTAPSDSRLPPVQAGNDPCPDAFKEQAKVQAGAAPDQHTAVPGRLPRVANMVPAPATRH